MKFKLDVLVPNFPGKITYSNKVIFLGSCFSDEISFKFKNAGFDILNNPFGTIFNPISLARVINNSIKINSEHNIFKSESSFKSWNCSTLFQEQTEINLIKKLDLIQGNFKTYIQEANYFFITFGSAWGYELVENDLIVANCHKENMNKFKKKLIESTELIQTWERIIQLIYSINPSINLIFTVSPVRHSNDGLIENNRSKARLFELISQLESKFPIKYFPSYELINDELRDYRFFKEDLVHPSNQAIDYVWQKIQDSFFDSKTLTQVTEVENLRKLAGHKIVSQNESEIQDFKLKREAKVKLFLEQNKDVKW